VLQAPFGDTVEGGAGMFVAPFTMPSIWLLQKSERDKRKNIYHVKEKHRISIGTVVTSSYRIQDAKVGPSRTRLIKWVHSHLVACL